MSCFAKIGKKLLTSLAGSPFPRLDAASYNIAFESPGEASVCGHHLQP